MTSAGGGRPASALPGRPAEETQSAELRYWRTRGLADWEVHWKRYLPYFPFESLDFGRHSFLDVGSGPLSILERLAPKDADVVACDALADAYNALVPEKKFPIVRDLPSRRFSRVFLFNMLDHMEDPAGFLREVRDRLADDGEIWLHVHINRPFSPEEHPQKFRYWRLSRLLQESLDLESVRLRCDGRLWPYAWCAIAVPRRRSAPRRAFDRLLADLVVTVNYAGFLGRRAVVKGMKLLGLRRLLPVEYRA